MPIFKLDEFLLNILPKKRLIGIDPGTKTLGIAVSNTDLTVASPIKTIKRKKLASDINELLKNKLKSKELYVLTIHNKIFICLVENNKLLFYNQFEFKGLNYIKYIILLFDEYKLDRNKTTINLLNESLNEEELKKFFSNIYLYKKSIFEIIDEYYG